MSFKQKLLELKIFIKLKDIDNLLKAASQQIVNWNIFAEKLLNFKTRNFCY